MGAAYTGWLQKVPICHETLINNVIRPDLFFSSNSTVKEALEYSNILCVI